MAAAAALQTAVCTCADDLPRKTAAGMLLFQIYNVTLQYFHFYPFCRLTASVLIIKGGARMPDLTNVKLIVCDMDGTLLDSRSRLPADFLNIFTRLKSHGIRFAAASGRSVPALFSLFQEAAKDMILIAENGCCVTDGPRPLQVSSFSPAQLAQVNEVSLQLSGIHDVFSSPRHAYVYRNTPEDARRYIDHFFESVVYFDDICEVTDEICELTVYDTIDAETWSAPYFSKKLPGYKVMAGAKTWTMISLPEADKGSGIRCVQEYLGIGPGETMVFGDYLNDVDMMPCAYFSYAMANAHPGLKKLCRFETLSNDEDGVMHVVRQILDKL